MRARQRSWKVQNLDVDWKVQQNVQADAQHEVQEAEGLPATSESRRKDQERARKDLEDELQRVLAD